MSRTVTLRDPRRIVPGVAKSAASSFFASRGRRTNFEAIRNGMARAIAVVGSCVGSVVAFGLVIRCGRAAAGAGERSETISFRQPAEAVRAKKPAASLSLRRGETLRVRHAGAVDPCGQPVKHHPASGLAVNDVRGDVLEHGAGEGADAGELERHPGALAARRPDAPSGHQSTVAEDGDLRPGEEAA